MINLDRKICRGIENSIQREWLETNGIGGYASGTVSGANTRRYHGLLVAATKPPLGRVVLLSKFEEKLIVNGAEYELSTNQYPGKIYPTGYEYLSRFRLDPFPIWTYSIDGLVLERTVFMPHGENTTVVEWNIIGDLRKNKLELEVRPLLAFRDHHHLRQDAADFKDEINISDGSVSTLPVEGLPELFFAHGHGVVAEQGYWYNDLEYAIEQERGFDFREQLFQPFSLKFDLGSSATVIVSTKKRNVADAHELRSQEMKRRANLVAIAGAKDEVSRQLVLAADQFIVDRGAGKTIIAGYHWFSAWGRDTMIALPGLTLSTNRPEIAKSILTEFSKHISQGMLPNRFPDEGETPDYNTVDATLWFFEAIRAYLAETDDIAFIRESIYEKLLGIIDWHIRGTRFNIHVDTDGVLFAGGDGLQLTWMDAKYGNTVYTPRTGKPVEIQALWYNALMITSDLATRLSDVKRAGQFSKMAEIAKDSFNGQFWHEDGEYLFDVINGEDRDASVRPNQIFAVSLHHSMLDPARARCVVEKVATELLTPFGLRSLARSDPQYSGVYRGSPEQRDSTYHQGTVWAWLIGPFVDAFRKVHSKDAKAEARIDEIVSCLVDHLNRAMVGQISEIFDADSPHYPRGCAAQAWSVAELARILLTKNSTNV